MIFQSVSRGLRVFPFFRKSQIVQSGSTAGALACVFSLALCASCCNSAMMGLRGECCVLVVARPRCVEGLQFTFAPIASFAVKILT